MTYLQQLEVNKKTREQYENDKIRLKEAISKLSELHSSYDGQFLTDLELFINNYKPKQ